MTKGWKIIGSVVLVLILLGAICIGVGFMTGGELLRVNGQMLHFNSTLLIIGCTAATP